MEKNNGSISSQPEQLRTFSHLTKCTCDYQSLPFLTRNYLSIFRKPKSSSCWRVKQWLSSCSPPQDLEGVYTDLLSSDIQTKQFEQSRKQIDLDIGRTFPDSSYFQSQQGQEVLRRCLVAYCKYDYSMGYVQGMNFIMASLLHHAEEAQAFWLFVGLMQDFSLREIYLPGFPGLKRHCYVIKMLILEFLPDFHRLLGETGIECQIFATEWCLSLFGRVIPVNQLHHVLDGFFARGWIYFYQLVMVFLEFIETKMEESEPEDMLYYLKISHNSQKDWKKFLLIKKKWVGWEQIQVKAREIDIHEDYIRILYTRYSFETHRELLTRNLC